MRRYSFYLVVVSVILLIVSMPGGHPSQALYEVTITTHRVPVPGYSRSQFGEGWQQHGQCNTRQEVILATLTPVEFLPSNGCQPPPGVATDPYSLEVISNSPSLGQAIDIDHIFPLAAAWDLGAWNWSVERRQAFANDPRNVVAVAREQNRVKSDKLPSEWLPPARRQRCWYVNRLAAVAVAYDLPLPEDDARIMRQQCRPAYFGFAPT